MVRNLGTRKSHGFKALLAVTVALGGLLWHILACTESPMAFSPDGRKLAFVTMEPYDTEKLLLAGTHAYRLMVLTDQKELRVVEETVDHMLSGPAYSADGKQLCYLRIPLLTKEGLERLSEHIKKQEDRLKTEATFHWLEAAKSKPEPAAVPTTQADASPGDFMVPSGSALVQTYLRMGLAASIQAFVVVRNAESLEVVSTTPVEWPLGDDPDVDGVTTYSTLHPQVSPDGKWVYFCAGNFLWGLNPVSGERRVYGIPANASLSPDGKKLALLLENAIGFMDTEGKSVSYRRLDGHPSLSGMAWVDDRTVAVLAKTSGEESRVNLYQWRSDSTEVTVTALPIPGDSGNEMNTGELAVSPDGKHVVVSYAEEVFFLDRGGRLVKHLELDEQQLLAQPVFSPDSKRVAMKYLEEPEGLYPRTAAIVFFSPDGKELQRVAIPKIDPTTTQPALPEQP